jgi:hypothetical protein
VVNDIPLRVWGGGLRRQQLSTRRYFSDLNQCSLSYWNPSTLELRPPSADDFAFVGGRQIGNFEISLGGKHSVEFGSLADK